MWNTKNDALFSATERLNICKKAKDFCLWLEMLAKGAIRKAAEATGDLIGNRIHNKMKIFLKHSQQHNLETVTNESDKEIPKERYIYIYICMYIYIYISRRKTRYYLWTEIKSV